MKSTLFAVNTEKVFTEKYNGDGIDFYVLHR